MITPQTLKLLFSWQGNLEAISIHLHVLYVEAASNEYFLCHL